MFQVILGYGFGVSAQAIVGTKRANKNKNKKNGIYKEKQSEKKNQEEEQFCLYGYVNHINEVMPEADDAASHTSKKNGNKMLYWDKN